MIYSVLEGKGAGNIYVDSVSEPQNALILPQGGFFYLASKDHSRNFLLQVKELVFQELMPAMMEKEMVLFALDEQTGKILDEIMADRGIIRIKRTLFDFNEKRYREIQRTIVLPDGYKVLRMEDAQLREYETAGNLGGHLSDRIGYSKRRRDYKPMHFSIYRRRAGGNRYLHLRGLPQKRLCHGLRLCIY